MDKKKRNLVLLILSIIAGMAYLTPLIRFTFYDQMVEALQISDLELGTIAGIYGIFNVLCYVPSGMLAEKFSAKKLLILSTGAMSLITFWYATFPGYHSLCIIHALYGIFSVGTFWSPYLKAVRNLGSQQEQGRLFGISEGLRGIAQTAVAFACLGVSTLFASVAEGFRATLLINGVVFGVLMLAVIFIVPDFDKKEEKTEKIKHSGNIFTVVLKTLAAKSTWLCIFVILCGYTLWNTINGYVGTYGTRVLGLSNELSSTLSIVRSYIIVFFAGISGGILMDKFKTKGKGMALTFAFTGIFGAAIFFTSAVPWLSIAVTLVLAYLVNVLKSTYWSIMGDAGISLAGTGMATGIISLIALTPDIFVAPIISQFLAYGEAQGDVGIGFDIMIVWLVIWSILGIGSGILLKHQTEKLRKIAK